METLSNRVLPLVAGLKLNDDKAKDEEMRTYFKTTLGDMHLYALYGQAQADFDKANYAAVAALLDPLVDAATKAVQNTRSSRTRNWGRRS